MTRAAPAAQVRARATAWLLVAAQVALLAAVVFLPGPAKAPPDAVGWMGLALEAAGLAVILVGAVQLGGSLTVLPIPNQRGELRTGGLYRFVRHPIYAGVIVFAVGAALRAPTVLRIVSVIALVVLLRAKAGWEERQLRHRYTDYEVYAARTGAVLPRRSWS